MDKKQSIFEILGAGKSFALGIVMAFLIIFSIGFFVLLFSDSGVSFGNSKTDKVLADFNQPTPVDESDTQPNDNQPSSEINLQPVTANDHIRGNVQTAEVIIVEFSDIDCPFCSRFHPTMQQIVEDYSGQVAWVYRHFPLDSLHPQARTKAEASECMADLGGNDAFWNFIDELYLDEVDDLEATAQKVGVDVSDFNDCLTTKQFASKVESHYQDAITSGGRGTPYSVALSKDGKRLPISGALPITDIKKVIDPLLQ